MTFPDELPELTVAQRAQCNAILLARLGPGARMGKDASVNEPIKSGDICEVIAGALGLTGPNVGKTVTVRALRGEHSVFGRIWQCEAPGLITEYGATGTIADFAQSWLRKLPPTEPHAANDERREMQA